MICQGQVDGGSFQWRACTLKNTTKKKKIKFQYPTKTFSGLLFAHGIKSKVLTVKHKALHDLPTLCPCGCSHSVPHRLCSSLLLFPWTCLAVSQLSAFVLDISSTQDALSLSCILLCSHLSYPQTWIVPQRYPISNCPLILLCFWYNTSHKLEQYF